MVHLGDITKISGDDVPAVDCIIGGSPCQDLSVAGKRAGLTGERSGLFMEQIRITKEMRARDREHSRTGNLVRPRFFVWENVAGALSSKAGEDFRCVLEEIARIAEPGAAIPRPAKKWRRSGCIVGTGWSIAWRILDAQFWGVPQRRRRIALVADFGGHAAPEVLFERKGVSWDTAPGGETAQGSAADAALGAGTAGYAGDTEVAKCLKAKSNLSFREDSDTLVLSFSGGQGAKAGGLGIAEECAPGLKAAASGSNRTPCICLPIHDKATRCNGGGETRNGDGAGNGLGVGLDGDPAPTLTAADRHGVACFDARGSGGGMIVPTLTGDHQRSVSDYTAIAVDSCDAGLKAVRRLTPLECERLQGYPDGWTDIGAWTDSKGKRHKESSDSARYKALGNSIALPPWKWVLKRQCACYERDATMASLFDGIGGFPLIWEQLNGKGSCLWASEIEEFPIAVTKRRFGAGRQNQGRLER